MLSFKSLFSGTLIFVVLQGLYAQEPAAEDPKEAAPAPVEAEKVAETAEDSGEPGLLNKNDYTMAGWTTLLGAIPYVGNTIIIGSSSYSAVKLARRSGSPVLKASLIPVVVGLACVNGYALYYNYKNSDNYLPGIMIGGLGSGATMLIGAVTANYLRNKHIVLYDKKDAPLIAYPLVESDAVGAAVETEF